MTPPHDETLPDIHLFTCAEYLAQGHHSQELTRGVASGLLRRLRRSVYCSGSDWRLADPDARHRAIVRAALRARRDDVAIHASALWLHRLPVVAAADAKVRLMSRVKRSRHHSTLAVRGWDENTVINQDLRAVALEVAIAQVAATGWRHTAVIAADAALHLGRTSMEALWGARAIPRHGLKRVESALNSVDARSESPGESWLRLILTDAGFGVEPQYPLVLDVGDARVDMVVTHRDFPGRAVAVEFDGRVKYRGDSSGEVLLAEKRREDAIRETGLPVLRVGWEHLSNPDGPPGRCRRLLSTAHASGEHWERVQAWAA